MKLKRIFKWYPFFIISLVFLIFSHQYFFKSLVPFPSRYLVSHFSPWNAYSEYAQPVKNNAMPDVIGQIYPWKKLTVEMWKSGNIPLWNQYSFSGTPHMANYQSQVFSPTNILYFFLPFIDAWSIQILLQPLLAGIFMYLYARSIQISKKGSTISSISFMFCGFITTWMAYGTLSFALLFLPLSLFAVERFLKKPKMLPLFTLSITIALSFFSGHFQTSIYVFGTILFYIFWKLCCSRDIKKALPLLLSAFSGVLFAFPQILPSLEFYQNSVRETIFQKMETIPWSYIPTRIAPDFFGNPVTRNDWFGHYAEWNSYAGLVPFALTIFSLPLFKERRVGFFISLFVASILLSHDTFVVDLLVRLHVPVLSTSAASRIIVLSSFSVAVLSGVGFDKLLTQLNDKKTMLLGFIPMALFLGGLWIVVLTNVMGSEKSHVARNNLLLPSALFAAFLLGILMLFFVKKMNIEKLIKFGIMFLVIFEMLRFAIKWMPFEERKFVYPQVPTIQQYKKLASFNRVYLDTHAENAVMYGLSITDGYDPLYIGRYGEFMKFVAIGELENGDRSTVIFPKRGTYTKEALNILGINHIAYRNSDGRADWAFPYWEYLGGQLSETHNDGKYTIFQNVTALPRAYAVFNTTIETDRKRILKKMFGPGFQASSSAIVEKDLGISSKTSNPQGTVDIKNYTNNRIEINADMKEKGLVVLSDSYYPGWNAYVDAKKMHVERVNYTFRGVIVPAGDHLVVFKYEPESVRNGFVGVFFGMIILLFLGLYFKLHGKTK